VQRGRVMAEQTAVEIVRQTVEMRVNPDGL